MKKVLKVAALFIITICMIGIMQTKSNASKIEINKEKKTLYVGATYYLKINGTNKNVKWSSTNKKIASVNSNGYKFKAIDDDTPMYAHHVNN